MNRVSHIKEFNLNGFLSILAGLLYLVGIIFYIFAILQGETIPAKTSWIIWAILDTITILGMCIKDTVNGQIIGAVIGGWIIVIIALKRGVSGWTKLDRFCFGGVILDVVIWLISNNPIVGILLSLGLVFIGSIQTFISAWKNPSREDRLAWTIYWFSCVCAIFAIPHWNLANAAQPVVFFAVETVMMCILYIRPHCKRVL